jgi:CO/xanthine dehydrogenase Mo-binding subunit
MLNAIKPGDVLPNGQITGEDVGIRECLLAVKDAYYKNGRTGIACAMKNSGLGVGVPDWGRCILSVEGGKIHVRTSAACMGQGVGTVTVQIAGQTIPGLTEDDFVVEAPDTRRTPDSGTSTASRQTLFCGEATRRAAVQLRDALEGKTLKDLEGQEFLGEYLGQTDPITSDKPHPVSHIGYSYSAQVVELDEQGKVAKVTAACDVGTVINQQAVTGQIEGGIVMGLGYALTEHFPVKDGVPQVKYGTLGLLRATQVPPMEIITVHGKEPFLWPTERKASGNCAPFRRLRHANAPIGGGTRSSALPSPGRHRLLRQGQCIDAPEFFFGERSLSRDGPQRFQQLLDPMGPPPARWLPQDAGATRRRPSGRVSVPWIGQWCSVP